MVAGQGNAGLNEFRVQSSVQLPQLALEQFTRLGGGVIGEEFVGLAVGFGGGWRGLSGGRGSLSGPRGFRKFSFAQCGIQGFGERPPISIAAYAASRNHETVR